jgi:hypothetical protein
MTPIVDGLGQDFEGRMAVFQLDAGQTNYASFQASFGLGGHPSFAVLDKNNRITQRYFGPQSEIILREAMEIALVD